MFFSRYWPGLGVVLLKLWLVAALPITAWGLAAHDDALGVRLAEALLDGRWLGSYDHLTLSKGPFYPLWLAAQHWLGMPLLVTQHLLYLVAVWLLLLALRPLPLERRWLWVLGAVLLCHPLIETRLLRDGLYPALSLLVLAGFIGLYTERLASSRRQLAWALLSGASLSAFWLTREEGLWLLPVVLWLLGGTVYASGRQLGWRRWLTRRLWLALLPLALLGASLAGVTALNQHYYGTALVVELKQGQFPVAYAALTRVQHPNWQPYLPVPAAVRQQIYAVSPAFAELQTVLEGPANQWGALTCLLYPHTCGDIGGSWLMWALREAVSLRGYYRDAASAEAYYRRLATEIHQACASGQLSCDPPRSPSILAQWRFALVKPILRSIGRGIGMLLHWQAPTLPVFAARDSLTLYSLGTPDSLRLFSDLSGSQVAPLPMPTVNAEQAVWPIDHQDLSQSRLTPAQQAFFNSLQQTQRYIPVDTTLTSSLTLLRRGLLASLDQVYRSLHPILAYAGLLAYLSCLWRSGRARQLGFLTGLNSALLVAAGARLGLLAVLDSTSFPAMEAWYLAPLYPLLSLFAVLALADWAQARVAH